MSTETEKRLLDFNVEAVYDEKISPLMRQIIAIAKEHGIPMFATFVYEQDTDGNGTGHCTTLINDIPDRHVEKLQECSRVIQRRADFMAFTISNGVPK